jgi:hypothetical protein
MIDDTPETPSSAEKFDDSSFPEDALFHDRRGEPDRRQKFGVSAKFEDDGRPPRVPKERRARKERRRRIDPTTFEKQYSNDELEFMNAMQQYKVRMCKSFPSHGEVLHVALSLGYRKVVSPPGADPDDLEQGAPDGAPTDRNRTDLEADETRTTRRCEAEEIKK